MASSDGSSTSASNCGVCCAIAIAETKINSNTVETKRILMLVMLSEVEASLNLIQFGETGTVKVYRRENDGSTVADVEAFHPFVWCDSDVVDLGIESEKLESDLKYGWLVTVDSWKELITLRNGLKNAGRDFFAFTDPVQHYLTATGRTLFKDL